MQYQIKYDTTTEEYQIMLDQLTSRGARNLFFQKSKTMG